MVSQNLYMTRSDMSTYVACGEELLAAIEINREHGAASQNT